MTQTIDFEAVIDVIRREHPEIEGWLQEQDIYFCKYCGKLIDSNWEYVEEVRYYPHELCCNAECAERHFGEWQSSIYGNADNQELVLC